MGRGRPAIGAPYEFALPEELREELEEIAAIHSVPLAEALRRAAKVGVAHVRTQVDTKVKQ